VRRVFVALAICFCSLALHGQKMRYGQELAYAKPGDNYPIKVHISAIHYRKEYIGSGQNADVLYADAVMNGKKIELRGDREVPFQYFKLPLGDYQARLVRDPHKMGDMPLFQIYEVVFPDRTVGSFTVTDISE
jgi:hypothetical protein